METPVNEKLKAILKAGGGLALTIAMINKDETFTAGGIVYRLKVTSAYGTNEILPKNKRTDIT